MQLQLEKTQVINPGSVGQPRDGDPRAAYAIIEKGQVEFRRVPYDIDQTIRHMQSCGIDESVIAKAEIVLRSGGSPSSAGSSEL